MMKNSDVIIKSLMLNFVLQMLDLMTTAYFVTVRGWNRELNPLIRWFGTLGLFGYVLLLALKLFYIWYPFYIYEDLIKKSKQEQGRWIFLFIGFNIYIGYAVVNNLWVSFVKLIT